jgi:hypothetical protein
MRTTKEAAYEQFWHKLQPAYPISHGAIRLPIVADIITIENLNSTLLLNELKNILTTVLSHHASEDSAKERARAAGDAALTHLIDDDYTGVVRFDCLWNPDTASVSVLEINCDYPDGLLLHDHTYSTLSGKPTNLHRSLLNQLYDQAHSTMVWHSAEAYFLDSYAIEANNLKALGLGGNMITDLDTTAPNTVIRRCIETSKIPPATFKKVKNSSLKFVNSIALRTLGYKDLLDKIEHPYILKTHKITTENSVYCNEHKDDLILKPLDGCEGRDIYFGHKINQVDWSKLISRLVNQNYVVQERAHIPKMKVRLYEAGTILEKILYYDLCPHFFIKNKQIIGSGHILMRFSENPVVNVTQGGGIGYYKL